MILIDNFSYTLFHFGIATTEGALRPIYAIFYSLIFYIASQKLWKFTLYKVTKKQPIKRSQKFLAGFMIIISILAGATRIIFLNEGTFDQREYNTSINSQLPNIILIGIDGLNSTNMSAYGYYRDTTPHIRELMKDALVFQNAFPNVSFTGGSLISILTSKLPTETRVVFSPDILHGQNAYEHLPGILKSLGYYTEQLTVPHYADAYDFNIKSGFDMANFITKKDRHLDRYIGGDSEYFSSLITQRVTERALHITLIKKIPKIPLATSNTHEEITDDERINKLLSSIQKHNEPVFIHVHLVDDTHGPILHFKEQYFSKGIDNISENQGWSNDAVYDDAILTADERIGNLFKKLDEIHELDQSFIILYSDHNAKWLINERVPLIIWFPHKDYTGSQINNVQNIDIAPTILDYIGVTIPAWMDGHSLIDDNYKERNIFGAQITGGFFGRDDTGVVMGSQSMEPPFYQIEKINLIVCDQWFTLDLLHPTLSHGIVSGYTNPCPADPIISPKEAQELILDHLRNHDYDITNFPADIPYYNIP
jgi:arylsulfatase A-like enzyme